MNNIYKETGSSKRYFLIKNILDFIFIILFLFIAAYFAVLENWITLFFLGLSIVSPMILHWFEGSFRGRIYLSSRDFFNATSTYPSPFFNEYKTPGKGYVRVLKGKEAIKYVSITAGSIFVVVIILCIIAFAGSFLASR